MCSANSHIMQSVADSYPAQHSPSLWVQEGGHDSGHRSQCLGTFLSSGPSSWFTSNIALCIVD